MCSKTDQLACRRRELALYILQHTFRTVGESTDQPTRINGPKLTDAGSGTLCRHSARLPLAEVGSHISGPWGVFQDPLDYPACSIDLSVSQKPGELRCRVAGFILLKERHRIGHFGESRLTLQVFQVKAQRTRTLYEDALPSEEQVRSALGVLE